ncbi:MAG: hypothetical protein SGBAC_009028 [Bacillariaceae sp.]
MGGIKVWKTANRMTHDPPGSVTKKSMTDLDKGLSKKKKKKNAAKKLKDFWEKKKQQQKNLSPKADEVSLKDAAMQLPTKKPQDIMSPRTAVETVESPLQQQLPVLSHFNLAEHNSAEQIFRRQKEAPGKKGLEVMEVVIPASAQLGTISPISIDNSAFYPQPRQQQPGVPGDFEQTTTRYTEGVGVEVELAQALLLPSLHQRNRRGAGISDDTTTSSRGRSRERAHNVSAPGRRRIRPNSGVGGRTRREPHVDPIFSTAIDLTDVENEQQAMKFALGLNDPANAFDDISNPLTAVPDVFGSLTDLLRDPPTDDDEEDDRIEDIGSFKEGSSRAAVDDHRDDSTMRGNVDVMKKENTKGAPFDPIDLTGSECRLLVRKPVEAINIGFVEDADDAYDEMIQESHNIVTKATHRMLGRNNTWYLG